jgi:hypothetical protein
VTAFEPISIWGKSQLFASRATESRDDEDEAAYHLWAACALEMLGKWMLAKINPALIVDPKCWKSLLSACGCKATATSRTITAKCVYERIKHIEPRFDNKLEGTCLSISENRNAELHSGESPIAARRPDRWEYTFWRVALIFLEYHGESLEAWVGKEEAQRIQSLLEEKTTLLKNKIDARIALYIKKSQSNTKSIAGTGNDDSTADAVENTKCPACSEGANLLGFDPDTEVLNTVYERDPDFGLDAYEVVKYTYAVFGFQCPSCGLAFDGQDELEAAGLPLSFERQDTREACYEEEYGDE